MSEPLTPRRLSGAFVNKSESASEPTLLRRDGAPFGWAVEPGLTDYPTALDNMEARAGAIAQGAARELVWLVEHPPVYTGGVRAKRDDLLQPDRFPVHAVGRGGEYTYHGPGQRVVYVMLDLGKRRRDVRAFVQALEGAIIDSLAAFGVAAGVREGRIGVWVTRDGGREEKIAAIGVKIRRWVTFHGAAINVAPDLSHFSGITPCGISPDQHGVTSLAALGVTAGMAEVDAALRTALEARFGASEDHSRAV